MSVTESYLQYLVDQLSDFGAVTTKKMFGGAGIYRDGVMFALVADDTLYFKADDINRPNFDEIGSYPFKPWANKPMTMPYYNLPEEIIEQPDTLAEWSRGAFAAAERGTKTKKPKKKKT